MRIDVTPEYRGHGRTAVSASGEGWTQSRRKGSGVWTPQSSFYFMSRILHESDSENPGPDVEPGQASASSQGPVSLDRWEIGTALLSGTSGSPSSHRGAPAAWTLQHLNLQTQP